MRCLRGACARAGARRRRARRGLPGATLERPLLASKPLRRREKRSRVRLLRDGRVVRGLLTHKSFFFVVFVFFPSLSFSPPIPILIILLFN